MRAAPAVAALMIALLSFGAPARGDDLELELDLPATTVKKSRKKPKPKPKAKPTRKAPPKPALSNELDLDLDLDLAPTPAPGKTPAARAPANDLDLELDLEPVPTRNPSVDLDLELDLEPVPARPQPPPRTSRTNELDLELDLELEPDPTPARPRPTTTAPADPGGVLLLPTEFADPFESEVKKPRKPRKPPMPLEPFHRWDVGLKVGGALMNALTDAGHAPATGAPTASRGFTIPAALELRVFPAEALRGVALAFEAGYFPKSGQFTRDLPHDPDFASLSAQWSMLAIPVSVGASWDLPWRLVGRRLGFGLRAAVLGQYVRSTTSWASADSQVAGAAVSAFAPGWLAGAEINLKLGKGFLVLDMRSAHAFTDLGIGDAFAGSSQATQPWASNPKGDLQGTTFLLGYRYVP